MQLHTTHPDIVKRLRRCEGHLKSIIAMIEQGRGCLEIAQQMQAVETAIVNAKKKLVHDHIDHCLDEAVKKNSGRALDEFKEITKYL